jgi:predicted AAA+ superfamily ATPase
VAPESLNYFDLEDPFSLGSLDEAYYWATYNRAELDLMLIINGRQVGIECKRMDSPRLTPSMRIALDDLSLKKLFVIYPGEQRLRLAPSVEAVPVSALAQGGKINFTAIESRSSRTKAGRRTRS